VVLQTSVSDLPAHLGFWLRAVSNHVSQTFATKLGGKDVTVAEWVLLRTLYGRDPMAPSRVAEAMGMTRGAVTKLADRLIAKHLVLRAASPDDGRAQTLALTPKGAKLVPLLAELADRNDAEFFGVLSPSERQALEHLLRRLVAANRMPAMPVD
jgi:DNA-binding MarR family transcriptional regulator